MVLFLKELLFIDSNPVIKKEAAIMPIKSESMEKDFLGVSVFNALSKNNIKNCGDFNECRRLFLLAEKECTGNINEKIFCLAVIDENLNYCKWIDLKWYAITCTAFLEKNIGKCMEIRDAFEIAPCIKDFVLNNEDANCGVLSSDWEKACEAFKNKSRAKCDMIDSGTIKKACITFLE
ncbi:MAG: hypothetical protein QXK06_02325 [Candidatus Diapherotrites archaeon]